MIELADTLPDVQVDQAEYQRLLGYPRGKELEGRAKELSDWARAWYAANGKPWVYVRQAAEMNLEGGRLNLDGARFACAPLRKSFERAEAHAAIVAAVGAGPEAETESQKLWQEEKPDEYFFLEMYSSAVVEHLVTMTGRAPVRLGGKGMGWRCCRTTARDIRIGMWRRCRRCCG